MLIVAYLGWFKPFSSNGINWLNLLNEMGMLACSIVYMLFTDINMDKEAKYDLGWYFVGLVGLIFLLNIMAILFVIG